MQVSVETEEVALGLGTHVRPLLAAEAKVGGRRLVPKRVLQAGA